MNEIIKKQLQSLKSVTFYDEQGNIIPKETIDNQTTLIIKSIDSLAYKKTVLLFTFKDYLINPFESIDFHTKFNRGITIPLKVMQGQILRTVGEMIYIQVKGFFYKTDVCNHCFKKELSNPICLDCYKKLNINEIEEVTWEGYVNKKDCIIEEI